MSTKKLKFTTESFVQRAKEIHGDKYDYSKTVYTGTREYTTITCKVHGDFRQIPNGHLSGKGCEKCSYEYRKPLRASNTQEFVRKAVSVHGDTYVYDNVNYTNSTTNVDIACKIHGNFLQTPKTHLRGRGCWQCGVDRNTARQTSNKLEFIQKSKLLFGELYDYSLVDYERSNIRVKIICNLHGVFEQSPNAHLRGNGCPSCSVYGFQKNKGGNLYIISCGEMIKVGITNNKVSIRMNQLYTYSNKQYDLIAEYWFDDGFELYNLEQKIHKYLGKLYRQPVDKFDGYTECFYNVDIQDLLNKIKENKWQL